MPKKTLDRIYERINILNLINQIECEQINLEIVYASIENDSSQELSYSAYEHHDVLQDIELRMSILEDKYNDLQYKLTSLGQR